MSAQVVVDDEYLKQIEKARCHLRSLILNNMDKAPLMLRLALHDAGTYDPNNKIKGGPNGSIRNQEELNHKANEGLAEAVNLCDQVWKEYKKITHADLYQLAGVVAVEITGGPTIDFIPGRQDSRESPEEGRLASDDIQDASKLRNINKRMGLSDGDFVALYGGLKRLVKSKDITDDQEKTATLKFDNLYFKKLQKDASKLEGVEKVLVDDKEFSKIVDSYAKDEEGFLRNYAAAHKKMSELGGVPKGKGSATSAATSVQGGTRSAHQGASASSSSKATSWNRARLAQGAIGIAVATTVVILGYFLSRRSK